MFRLPLKIAAAMTLAATTHLAYADVSADKAAITQRLQRWSDAFNARDARSVCDLFAPDLVSTVPGALNGNRDAVCSRLARVLARNQPQLRYEKPEIREIIVSGNIAVVRLFWTLTTQAGSRRTVTHEAGMDIFGRQPDGTWSIIRFISFDFVPHQDNER